MGSSAYEINNAYSAGTRFYLYVVKGQYRNSIEIPIRYRYLIEFYTLFIFIH